MKEPPSMSNSSLRSIAGATALAGMTGLLAACSGGPVGSAHALPPTTTMSALTSGIVDTTRMKFTTLDDNADPTFNQLLGINDNGVIAGYFGSGAAGHPNQGYMINPPYSQSNYVNENFPGSVQTQVTAIDDIGNTAGFWVDANGNNFGFVEWNGVFTSYKNPKTGAGTVNQLLGLNNHGTAVGFYVDGGGLSHGYELNQATGRFSAVASQGCTNVFATGINNHGSVTGFCTGGNGVVIGFLRVGHTFSEFSFPSASATTPFGINDKDEVVGAYTDASGNSHGFTLTSPLTNAKWMSIDDPNGVGGTFVNGLNDMGALVGFYVDAAGNTDGFLATRN
jgi:hypothetical protein